MAGEDRQLLRMAAPRRGRFDWNAERIALLRQRWAEGLSASSIAKELGPQISRSAVLGKVHRLKLVQPAFKRRHPEKEKASPRRRGAPRKPRRRAGSGLLAAFDALRLAGRPADLESTHQHAAKAFGPTCTLLDLTNTTCRWPVGDPGQAGFAFCGAAVFHRYPYCLAHCLIAYRAESGERAAPAMAGQRAWVPRAA
jgi:GcrA cell cycle regulator